MKRYSFEAIMCAVCAVTIVLGALFVGVALLWDMTHPQDFVDVREGEMDNSFLGDTLPW